MHFSQIYYNYLCGMTYTSLWAHTYSLYKICLDKFYNYVRYNYLDITPHKFIIIHSIVFHIEGSMLIYSKI